MNTLRLGHAKFPAHLNRIKIVSFVHREHCNSDVSILDYLILNCLTFNIQRLVLLDGLTKIYKDENIPRFLPSLLENEKNLCKYLSHVISTFDIISSLTY